MKRLSLICVSILVVMSMSACKDSTTESTIGLNAEELAKLQSENRVLKGELAEKDSVLNESILLFNEIEENLSMINLKEDEIRLKSKNVELAEDGKQWILQEIQNINYLREANAKKVASLNKQLKNSNGKIAELDKLITNLRGKIETQDEEIEMLRTELSDLDREYVELLEAYQEQSTLAAETLIELNTAYYAYGTYQELAENGVLVKEGGFIGLGKKMELSDEVNMEYFTKIDISRVTTIEMDGGKKIKFISDHPSSSYQLESNDTKHKLTIIDPAKFWKVSKVLVATID
ncbi:hypothetical protein DNU06_07730 [Putridiphycobacter roseus]|uniref:Uncharacterized protein n=1 Tax=Putridiphycobacter roseus TaxID=2219161 RepID=A0A2W1N2E8_9FLAO|nr:hypothetical protein [Putridiphycobacter roseus]PZE17710.1 hypothetical protein DNU06_07730 [Putridiphycobacter roseus]